jgi:hypothetical protein
VARVNAATGAATVFTGGANLTGLASIGSTLYGIRRSGGLDSLVTINRSTGAFTTVGSTGLTDIQALAGTPQGGLVAWSTANGLMNVNPVTGAISDVSGAGGGDIQTLEYDQDGVLYGLNPTTDRFVRVDPATGLTTDLFTVTANIRGMAHLSNPVSIIAAGPDGTFEINVATGKAVSIGGTPRNWKSLAYMRGPDEVVGVDGFNWYFIDQGNGATEQGAPYAQSFRAICEHLGDLNMDMVGIVDGAFGDTLHWANSNTGLTQMKGATGFNHITGIDRDTCACDVARWSFDRRRS